MDRAIHESGAQGKPEDIWVRVGTQVMGLESGAKEKRGKKGQSPFLSRHAKSPPHNQSRGTTLSEPLSQKISKIPSSPSSDSGTCL